MMVLLGVGNDLRGDDFAGSFIARSFKNEKWIVIDAGIVPENYIGKILNLKPEMLVIVDAVDMDLEPGAIRRIPLEKISSGDLNTHRISLKYLISILKENIEKIVFIGIQPKNGDLFSQLSPEVLKSCELVIKLLATDKIENIESL